MQPTKGSIQFDNKIKNQSPKFYGVQFYFLVIISIILLYELVQAFVFSGGPPISFDDNSSLVERKTEEPLTVEIFSAPKPFVGEDREVNLRAIRSWQSLKPRPKITLLGYESGYDTIATEYGLHLQSEIDKTFLGVPLFNSMVDAANQSEAKVTVIINGDIILLQDFMDTLCTVTSRFEDFLAISARYDLASIPDGLSEDDPNFYQKLGQYARENGNLHTYGGMDLWAWNPNGPRLFDPIMPHFIFGRGKYDNWLTHETIAAERRAVIDVSEVMLSIHIKHGYDLVQVNDDKAIDNSETVVSNEHEVWINTFRVSDSVQNMKERRRITKGRIMNRTHRRLLERQNSFWSEDKKSKFELFINIYLSLHIGTYENQLGTIFFAPWRLATCLEERGNCFIKRARPGVCNCEYSPASSHTQTEETLTKGSRVIKCGTVSHEEINDFEIPLSADYEENTFGMPLTLESLAERVAVDHTLVMTAVTYGYRNMLMNWACNMRRLRIRNFIIAALDLEMYRFGFVRGLPVYLDDSLNMNYMNRDGENFTMNYPPLSPRLRVVSGVLKLGYDVVWSDTDIVWFRNPVAHLQTFGTDLAIQSNADDNEPGNALHKINSSFFLARSTAHTMKFFADVIELKSKTRKSEQTCFYDVLCGDSGEQRFGNDSCLYGNSAAKILDRTLYPNGATQGIWDVTPGTMKTAFAHIYIVHNNWLKGGDGRWGRLRRHGLVYHDMRTGLCRYNVEEEQGSIFR